ncbi:MAG: hypothetical protein F4029_05215 [Gammaproteobacteria bacterium]|nr:hypothetical protein [Gammaproteobacteria bacterium]MYF27741.1 hypothetical protein [Gammaproteobacteria bacterium]MYK45610.1 hypothetical protein [Gammaproteobacteria bacterium]
MRDGFTSRCEGRLDQRFLDEVPVVMSIAAGEEYWGWAEQGFEAYQLMGIADRLAAHITRNAVVRGVALVVESLLRESVFH